jgi:ankyrin repeat protein
MLAELRSADLTATTASSSSSRSSRSGSGINPNNDTSTTFKNMCSTASSTTNACEIPVERIIEAVKQGNIGQLRRWARQGLRISSGVPLFHAVMQSRLDVVQCLVNELGADVNKPDDRGRTPLCVTAQMGVLAIMRALAKNLYADVNKTDQAGHSPLWIAARVGDLAVVQCLVKELGADVDL